jgi:hypothetical protein
MLTRAIHAAVLALAFAAALCVRPVAAQPVDEKALAAAKELITVMRATDQIKQMLPNIMQMIKPMIIQGRADVEKDVDAMIPVLLEGMSSRVGELADQMATLYARNFTADEMKQMTAFYLSPVGQKFLEKMPTVAQQSMQIGQAFGQKVAIELQSKLAEEMRKKGHDVPAR